MTRRERFRGYANHRDGAARQGTPTSGHHDGGDGLERRPPAGTARRRRATGRIPVPREFLLVGNPGVRRDPYLGVADTVRSAAGPAPTPNKADGKEPPAALRAAVPAPIRRNVHDRVLRTPRRARKWRGAHVGLTTRHPPWFRAPARCRPEAGPVLPVGAPSRPRHYAIGIRALTPIRHHVAANLALPATVSMRNSG